MPRCEHCATDAEIQRLCCVSLPDLTDDDLYNFTWHAPDTIGEVIDFKHFLPRIFEVMLFQNGSIDVEIITGKLPRADWRKWPQAEQEAIAAFFDDWWRSLLSVFPAPQEAESCLCAIAQAVDDLSPFLEYWRGCRGSEALQHVAALLNWNYGGLMKGEALFSPWWKERQFQMGQVRDWLLSKQTGRALEAGFFQYSDQPFAKQLSDAVQQFGWIQEALTISTNRFPRCS
jgi:hypothetical protein